MRVCYSRFTPGLSNATDVGLQKGDKVVYRRESGQLLKCVLLSELLRNRHDDTLGYEATVEGMDGPQFLSEWKIVDWEGKCETMKDTKRAIAEGWPGI